MNTLSQMAAAILEHDTDEPVMEYEGRWYTRSEVRALATQVADLIDASGAPADAPVGGFKLPPETFQDALVGHPAVSAAAAGGLPDRRLGQVPAVAIQLKPGAATPTMAELEVFLRQHVLARHIPAQWLIVDELPKTVSLKVDRPAVAQMFNRAPVPRERSAAQT